MPYKEWQALHQKEASAEQKAEFAAANPGMIRGPEGAAVCRCCAAPRPVNPPPFA